MANKSKVQSVEPDIADLVNGWLKSYGLDYKLEQASLNSEIDKALDEYHSKIGGKGGNRPDAKLLLKDKYGTFYPVLIEYKGYKDKLVKLDTDGIVDNKKDKNEPNYTNIKSYAVNGAIHYANAILHYTSYTRIIVQGRRLKKDDQIAGDIPFVMAGVTNTGVVGYISNPVASFPKNSITIDIFGNAFYRNYDFGAGDDTGVYWSEKSDYSKEIMLFLTCSMGKSIENKFSYGKKLRSSQSFKFKMQLPVKNEQPDYELMSTLISAIQKLVIADVVKFSDEKIKATKQVVG